MTSTLPRIVHCSRCGATAEGFPTSKANYCRACHSADNKARRARQQQATLGTAERRGERYSEDELEVALAYDEILESSDRRPYHRWSLTAEETAYLLDRTLGGILSLRDRADARLLKPSPSLSQPKKDPTCQRCWMVYNASLAACPNCG